jgi:hypothetical protein
MLQAITQKGKPKMKIKLLVTLACLALVVPVLASGVLAADRSNATPAPWSNTISPKVAQANTDQCDDSPCVAPEICCRLSGLESACIAPDDCFRKQQKLKKK